MARALFEALFESSPEAILVAGPGESIVAANPAASELFGFSRAELCHGGLALLSDPTAQVPEPRTRHRGERCFRHKGGDRIPAEVSSAEFATAEGPRVSLIIRDLRAQRAHEQRLRQQARTDILTGLPNRLALVEHLGAALLRARTAGRAVGLAFLDLDAFKAVNDRFGHSTGDRILVEVGERLRRVARATDLPARLAGDEFVLVVDDLPDEGARAEALMRRVTDRVRQVVASPVEVGAPPAHVVPCSIGWSLFPRDADEAGALIELADQAMYRRKQLRGHGPTA